MTDEVGLPVAARQQISTTLSTAFAVLPRELGNQAIGDGLDHALRTIVAEFGYLGLFEAACAAALLVSDGPMRGGQPGDMTGEWKYMGFGPTAASSSPSRPIEYTVSRFATAVMHGRRSEAWALWTDLQPPQRETVGEDATTFLALLMRNAWTRQRGGALQVTLRATKWPPVCDFCCGETALWMWHCVGADVTIADPRPHTGGDLTLRMDDMEYWFACRICRSHIAQRKPRWGPVWQRHHRTRPNAQRADTMLLFKLYEQIRTSVLPVPLPAERPQPSEAFYRS